MSGQDPVVALLKDLNRPASPRPEFAEALRAQLLAELAEPDGAASQRGVLGKPLKLRHRRRVLAGAVALALVAAIVMVVLLSRPVPASAVDVILQAQRAFATIPPFQATMRMNLNPDGKNPNSFVPKGATEAVVISYGGPGRFRAQIVGQHPRFGLRSVPGPGSYVVYDGRRHVLGDYDALRKRFYSFPAPSVRPLEFLSWHGAYPDWERICRSPGSKVLPDTRIDGRQARHIRCDDYQGGSWQLWIDRRTGLLLKIVGQVGGDDLFPGLEMETGAKGGFQLERLHYRPSFPAGTFRVAAPAGALDYWGRLKAAADKVPSFRAIVTLQGPSHRSVDEVWWRKGKNWRTQVLSGVGNPYLTGGAGSFEVYAHGGIYTYNARDRSHSSVASASLDRSTAVNELLPEGVIYDYSTAACPIVGHDRIAGRDAVHRHCSSPDVPDVWVDTSTGLILREHAPGYDFRVRSIDYSPVFPANTFRTAAPARSRSAQQLQNDPYYKTTLTPGKPAPNWQAPKLGGGTFRPSDLRGRPALILLFSDTCGAGDPTCNVFPALEQTYEKWKNRVGIVWVDLQGTAKEAKAIQHHNHLALPVVVDDWHRNVVIKAWNIQAYPYWLLLDAHGRVIEAQFKPQTTTQLDQLLAKAK
jgi:hypothetical protein